MSVLIKGMEMPKEPTDIVLYPDGWWKDYVDGTSGKCFELPPHGRLINADVLAEIVDGIWDCNDLYFQPNDKICDPDDCKGCK